MTRDTPHIDKPKAPKAPAPKVSPQEWARAALARVAPPEPEPEVRP